MEKLTTLTGVAVPLRRSNVDTDQIIPAVFLKRVKKSGFDDALFYAWRRDPEFVLNKPEYKQGKILVAGPDFGIGSSREHAVWALHDYGFRADSQRVRPGDRRYFDFRPERPYGRQSRPPLRAAGHGRRKVPHRRADQGLFRPLTGPRPVAYVT